MYKPSHTHKLFTHLVDESFNDPVELGPLERHRPAGVLLAFRDHPLLACEEGRESLV